MVLFIVLTSCTSETSTTATMQVNRAETATIKDTQITTHTATVASTMTVTKTQTRVFYLDHIGYWYYSYFPELIYVQNALTINTTNINDVNYLVLSFEPSSTAGESSRLYILSL